MVSMEIDKQPQATCRSPDRDHVGPRISFSCDLDEDNISINLSPIKTDEKHNISNFEFLSDNKTQSEMLSADELFFEGKLLPYWQTHQSEKLKSVKLNNEEIIIEMAAVVSEEEVAANADDVKEENRVRTWFIDDDPSPRPPNCSVLWKELLRLKSRQKAYTLSPSSSSSSTSSSSSLDMSKEEMEKDKNVKRVKKSLERTRSASIRIRPMVNVPICTPQSVKQSNLPPMFPMRRSGR